MASLENGERRHEIQEGEKEAKMTNSSSTKLNDYIGIYMPPSGNGLIDHPRRPRKRFLDFLRAHPSKEWFQKFGIVGRLSPFAFLRRVTSRTQSLPPPGLTATGSRRRFRVPFVRKISWPALFDYCKKWIRHPMNIALLVWIVFIAAGLVILALLMTGILNEAIPKSSVRKRWTEITNQILNALFTIMCLYQHPRISHHLVLLFTWSSTDIAELRKIYCKNSASGTPYDRVHIAIVVFLLHVTCLSQYGLCALYWGFTSKTRPDWAETFCIAVGIAAPVLAGLYTMYSPLARKGDSISQDDSQSEISIASKLNGAAMPKQTSKRVIIARPRWVGGLFDCWDDVAVAYLSFFCTICVFGWNMERLGFGNMYVHIVTFILLLVAPFLVFNVAALNIGDDTVKYAVGGTGILLCFFGLFYGGFWRSQMRRRFKLPGNPLCCNNATVTDFMQWLFCWPCSLAQEVRTGNFYDVEDDSFCMKGGDSEDGESRRPVLAPLPREGGAPASHGSLELAPLSPVMEAVEALPVSVGCAATVNGRGHESLVPPVQPLIQVDDAQKMMR